MYSWRYNSREVDGPALDFPSLKLVFPENRFKKLKGRWQGVPFEKALTVNKLSLHSVLFYILSVLDLHGPKDYFFKDYLGAVGIFCESPQMCKFPSFFNALKGIKEQARFIGGIPFI